VKARWPTIVIAAMVGLLLLVYLVAFQVRVSEVAVHRRLGGVHRVLNQGEREESGWYVKIPLIDRVRKYDRRVRVFDGRFTQMQLGDGWHVAISMYAGWRVSDPVEFESTLKGDVGSAEHVLKDIILNATNEVVGKIRFQNLISTDPDELMFGEIEKQIVERVRRVVDERNLGVTMTNFGIGRLAVPESTTEAVFKRMTEERAQAAGKRLEEGKTEKARLVAEATIRKEEIIANATAEAKRIRGEGEAAEAQYYDAFAAAPGLATFLRGLESLRTIAQDSAESNSPITFVLDLNTPPFGLLKQGPLGSDWLDKTAAGEAAEEPASRNVTAEGATDDGRTQK